MVGAGTGADDRRGAGSATGPGEAIIRVSLVERALALVAGGLDPARAAQLALDDLAMRTGALAGLVLVDAAGRIGAAHTTATMAAAYRSAHDRGVVLP
jgi:isoaspartyl peptidase/L-asparaginase-like protein (Ntn-hydrolase superfamily)